MWSVPIWAGIDEYGALISIEGTFIIQGADAALILLED